MLRADWITSKIYPRIGLTRRIEPIRMERVVLYSNCVRINGYPRIGLTRIEWNMLQTDWTRGKGYPQIGSTHLLEPIRKC